MASRVTYQKYREEIIPLMTKDLYLFMKDYIRFFLLVEEIIRNDSTRGVDIEMNFHRQLLSDNLRDHGYEDEDAHRDIMIGSGWDLCVVLTRWYDENHKHTD